MRILFAASECIPFVKTGGLADVVGALAKELKGAGEDVRVILPLYRGVPEEFRERMVHKLNFYVNLGWRRQYCGIEELEHEGVIFYFVDNEYYFDRHQVYGYGDEEGERYAFFCRSVLEALPLLDFAPQVLHCHDWQSGMIPVLLREQYRAMPFYTPIKTVFTIHNLQYQGVFAIDYIEDMLGLGPDKYVGDKLEFYGGCSFMKAALVYADAITTVSPSYAREIQTPYYGERLDGLLRARGGDLQGILNGLDTKFFDPQADPMIYRPYGADNWKANKAYNKACLQADLGLRAEPDAPLIGLVTRLSPQKGLDLVQHVFGEIMQEGAQVAVLGKGEEGFVNFFSWAAWRYEGQTALRAEMNETLAHRMYAGCDMLLMPSLFEPCGLSQMIAMRYGTVPIVRETGGLCDTVLSYNEQTGQGNGFTFHDYNAHDMLYVVRRAIEYYRGRKQVWNTLVERGMGGDYSWEKSSKAYRDLYGAVAGA